MALLAGCQFEPYGLQVTDHFQGYVAPLGVETILPVTLSKLPRSREATRLFVGSIATGLGRLARLGVDWDVDLTYGKVKWLATARFALTVNHFTSVRYLAMS